MKNSYFPVRMMFVFSVMSLFIGCKQSSHSNKSDQNISYAELVGRLTNMKALAILPKKGEKTAMWSSYDRASKVDSAGNFIDWAANIDGLRPQYIRKEGDNEVLAEMKGPGAIVRMWSASPKKGKVKIYIDGKEKPIIDKSFIDYFKPSIPAFDFNQLVYETKARGFNNYVPIPYNKSCKIVAEPGWGQYYQFNYISFPKGTFVEKFDPTVKGAQQVALTKINTFFNKHMGDAPYQKKDFKKTAKNIILHPGEKKTVIKLKSAGAISELRINVKYRDPGTIAELLRKTSIRMKWDGKSAAAVWSPLGDFFGTSPGWNEYRTLPMGMTKKWMYSYWYMPFAKGAEIILENKFDKPIQLQLEIKHEQLTKNNVEDYARFHAKWHRDLKSMPKDRWPDWRLLETKGKGRFVGTHLLVWNPKGGSCSLGGPGYYWWGEGDEKFFIDGENFPSTFGTGTEDYFGYAWCDPAKFQRAFHSQTQNNDNMGYQPMNRWHIIDNIPFQKSFDGYLEKYFPNSWPTQYATIVYWYLAPGGEDPLGKVPMKDRYGYETPYHVFRKDSTKVVGGEAMKIDSNTGGWATTDNFANEKLYKTVSGHKILLWFAEKGKKNRLEVKFNWGKSGSYKLYANVIQSKQGGKFRLQLNNTKLKPVHLKSKDSLKTARIFLGKVKIKAGFQKLEFLYDGVLAEKKKPLKLDYLEFVKQ